MKTIKYLECEFCSNEVLLKPSEHEVSFAVCKDCDKLYGWEKIKKELEKRYNIVFDDIYTDKGDLQ